MHSAVILLALGLLAVPMLASTLTVVATPEQITWSGASAGCVYRIDPDGWRERLGCSYTPAFAPPPGILYPGDLVEVRYPTPTGPRAGRATVREEPMDTTQAAQAIAAFVSTIAAAGDEDRRPLLAALYKELQAAGLPEPAAAALQHQIAQATQGLGLATPTAQTSGGTIPVGGVNITKE